MNMWCSRANAWRASGFKRGWARPVRSYGSVPHRHLLSPRPDLSHRHYDRPLLFSHYALPFRAMSTTTASSSVIQTISVAVVGVGLVGTEFVRQLLSLPQPHPFRIVSLSSSKTHLFSAEGLDIEVDTWKEKLGSASGKADVPALVRELAALVTPGRRVVLVDNTSSDAVAGFYPEFLRVGVNVVTPNKKAFSSNLDLYERILSTSLESGARFYNESTVGAGLPIINTLKDLVATGDQVGSMTTAIRCVTNRNYRSLRSKAFSLAHSAISSMNSQLASLRVPVSPRLSRLPGRRVTL
jgi:hypothetical protein